MNYTIRDVIEELKIKYGRNVSIATVSNLIRWNNFYNRGLAYKEENGYTTDGNQCGKIWKISRDGVNELLDLIINGVRIRKSRSERIEERQQELKKNQYIPISFELRKDLKEQMDSYLQLMEITQKDYFNDLIEKNMKEKNIKELVKEIDRLKQEFKRKWN